MTDEAWVLLSSATLIAFLFMYVHVAARGEKAFEQAALAGLFVVCFGAFMWAIR